MQIIQTIPSIADEASGGNYVAAKLCETLADRGMGLCLATLEGAGISSAHNFVNVFPLGFGLRRLGVSPAMRRWLFSQAISHSVDLIHNHSLWMMPNVYPGMVAKRYDIPLVVSPHGTLSEWAMKSGSIAKRVFWPMVQRPALSAVSCFHATARSEYEDIRRMGFSQPVATIPNGVDIPDFMPKKQREKRTLLFLGRIHPIKGLDMLLPAWQAVQDRFPEWDLRIVGPGKSDCVEEMKRLAAELGLKRIEFTGPLYGKKKTIAYAQADLFILPTYSENFGMAVAEALAAGTPAIVTKGAPWDGLGSYNCGWWCDISVDALVASIEEALSCSRESLEEKGLRGRDWMRDEFSWEQIGKKMAETYYWICHGGKKPDWVIEL